MGNQLFATYYIGGEKYEIYGCWDNETEENKIDFYDLYDEKGNCLNEGNPFWECPSWWEIRSFINTL